MNWRDTNLHLSACEEWESHVGQTHGLVPRTSPIKVEISKIMASIWWQYNTILQVPILDMFKNILEKILINYVQLFFAWVICWRNCIWDLRASPCDNISDVFLTHCKYKQKGIIENWWMTQQFLKRFHHI